MRGNPFLGSLALRRDRSIPACAGEPRILQSDVSSLTVYPRVCGGTCHLQRQADLFVGLSPRVRGNRHRTATPQPHARSIPACAGEPAAAPSRVRGPRVYPRVCGGTGRAGSNDDHDGGLSPRVRGNPPYQDAPKQLPRSIPACAGEPDVKLSVVPLLKVYPRVCGGTPFSLSIAFSTARSIPACAGEPALFVAW